jgi:hypothetical protein
VAVLSEAGSRTPPIMPTAPGRGDSACQLGCGDTAHASLLKGHGPANEALNRVVSMAACLEHAGRGVVDYRRLIVVR